MGFFYVTGGVLIFSLFIIAVRYAEQIDRLRKEVEKLRAKQKGTWFEVERPGEYLVVVPSKGEPRIEPFRRPLAHPDYTRFAPFPYVEGEERPAGWDTAVAEAYKLAMADETAGYRVVVDAGWASAVRDERLAVGQIDLPVLNGVLAHSTARYPGEDYRLKSLPDGRGVIPKIFIDTDPLVATTVTTEDDVVPTEGGNVVPDNHDAGAGGTADRAEENGG